MPFNFIVGGRATGKTYGALKYAYESHTRFILMRRTQAQTDLINKPEFNPYKAINQDMGTDIQVKSISKYNSKIYEPAEDGEQLLGYTCALSTISNLRGFDASDCRLLVWDEFIPEKHERPIKGEGAAFLNAYKERGILLVLLQHSKISRAKADTALYRLSSGSYRDMALSNDFVYNNSDSIKAQALKEYKLLCTVGEISIYRHKSKREYYVSEHRTGTAPVYKSDEVGLMRYRRKHGLVLYPAYVNNRVMFENILTKSLFELYTI